MAGQDHRGIPASSFPTRADSLLLNLVAIALFAALTGFGYAGRSRRSQTLDAMATQRSRPWRLAPARRQRTPAIAILVRRFCWPARFTI
jgi:hypothetical protein